jgi:hypothetical protein
MPGRETTERTFAVTRVLPNGRVELANLQGEHSIAEFESQSRLAEIYREGADEERNAL